MYRTDRYRLARTGLWVLGFVLLQGWTHGPDDEPAASRPEHMGAQQAVEMHFSTYLGGRADEVSSAIVVDAAGFIYVAGQTRSSDFPTQSPLQGYRGGPFLGTDGFVAKYTPGGEALVYATYLGGTGDEVVTALAVDAQGRACIGGSTTSQDFPPQPALHAFRSSEVFLSDAFLACLAPDGAALEYGTYLGGTGDESINALVFSPDGQLVATGGTTSLDFPTTPGALQPTRGGEAEVASLDGFVVSLTPDGAGFDLEMATYLGGSHDDIPSALALDAGGNIWLAGLTTSGDLPLHNPAQSTYAGPLRNLEGDAFLVQLTENGTALGFATYLGGRQADQATGLALDAEGRVILTGWTQSHDLTTTAGAYQPERLGIRERFVARYKPMGEAWTLDYLTRLGTPGGYAEGIAGLALDPAGGVFIAGSTRTDQFPIREATQAGYGGGTTDGFLARFDADGTQLGFSTYLGGGAADLVTGLALHDGTLCLTGGTGSTDFPVQVALQAQYDGPQVGGTSVGSIFVTCYDVQQPGGVGTEDASDLPGAYALHGNFPNPFRTETTIRFDVQAPARVVLTLYDVLGRRQGRLLDQDFRAGRHAFTLEAIEHPSGTYFYVIEMADFRAAGKMTLIR